MYRLKLGLQGAGLWPEPGQVAPPCGYTPAEMRQIIRRITDLTGGELLFAMYQVCVVLETMKSEFAPSEECLEDDYWTAFASSVIAEAEHIIEDADQTSQPAGYQEAKAFQRVIDVAANAIQAFLTGQQPVDSGELQQVVRVLKAFAAL